MTFEKKFDELLRNLIEIEARPRLYTKAFESVLHAVPTCTAPEVAKALLAMRRTLDKRVVIMNEDLPSLPYSRLGEVDDEIGTLRGETAADVGPITTLEERKLTCRSCETAITSENLDTCEWNDDHREQYEFLDKAVAYVRGTCDLNYDNPRKTLWHELRKEVLNADELALVNQIATDYPWEVTPARSVIQVSLSAARKIRDDVEHLLGIVDQQFPGLATRAVVFPSSDTTLDGSTLARSAEEVPDDLLWRGEVAARLHDMECWEQAAQQAGIVLAHPEKLPGLTQSADLDKLLNFVLPLCVYPHNGDYSTIGDLMGTSKNGEATEKAQDALLAYAERLVSIGYKSWTAALFGDPLNCWLGPLPLDLVIAFYAINTPVVDSPTAAGHRFTMGQVEQAVHTAAYLLEERREELARRPWFEKIILKDACSFLLLDACAGWHEFRWLHERGRFLIWLEELCERMLADDEAPHFRALIEWADELERVSGESLPPDLRLVLGRCARKLPQSMTVRGKAPAISAWKLRQSPVEQVQAIETCLHEIVVHVLQKAFGDTWWRKGVAEAIRVKAATRREQDDDQIPPEGYLNLLDHRSIIANNWTHFARTFASSNAGKTDSLKWLGRLNDIRNRLAHAPKMRYKPVTAEEEAFLDERLTWLRKVTTALGLSATPTAEWRTAHRASLN